MDKKTIGVVVSAAIFIVIWQLLILPSLPDDLVYRPKPNTDKPQEKEMGPENRPSLQGTKSPEENQVTIKKIESKELIQKTIAAPPKKEQAVIKNIPEKTYEIKTNLLHAIFLNHGGVLRELSLLEYHPEAGSKSELVLIDRPAFLHTDKALPMEGKVVKSDDRQTIIFENALYKKSYTFVDNSYQFEFQIESKSNNSQKLKLQLPDIKSYDQANSTFMHGLQGGICSIQGRDYSDNSTIIAPANQGEEHIENLASGQLIYAGFRDKYFANFIEPDAKLNASQQVIFKKGKDALSLNIEIDHSIAKYNVYAGPVNKENLYSKNQEKYAPLFNYTGFDAIIHFLLWLLDFYNSLPGINMGIAILLLTLTVKACLFPLNLKAQTSMHMMSKLGPEMKALQEKYKNDRQQLGVAQMKLFKDNGVNPLAGCLPMFIQMPVFISLFSTIGEGFSLRHAPFFGWMQDLSAPDRFHVLDFNIFFIGNGETTNLNLLVFFYIITMFIQQSMMPKSTDPNQQQMQKTMKIMMIFFAVMLYNYSSGLMLYFVGSNVLGMVESWYIKSKVLPKKFKDKK